MTTNTKETRSVLVTCDGKELENFSHLQTVDDIRKAFGEEATIIHADVYTVKTIFSDKSIRISIYDTDEETRIINNRDIKTGEKLIN